jgi:hypothetical protein
MITTKGSTKQAAACDLQNLVDGYDKMMEDPKAYAEGTYQDNIRSQGRPWGGPRDARTKANKLWDRNDIPV